MKVLHKGLALLLCVTLCVGLGSAMAGEDNAVSDWEAKYERLLRFAVEVKAWDGEEWGDDDGPIYPTTYLYLDAETYEKDKTDAADDKYAGIESLTLSGFNQAQFADIFTQTPNLDSLSFWDCDVTDFSPLLPIAPQLTLWLTWEPGLLEQLAVLPNLYSLDMSIRQEADLSLLAALTGLEKLTLRFENDLTFDISSLGMMPGLRSLELDSWKTPSDTLPGMSALEELKLYCEIDVAQLEQTPALQKLYLNRHISDDLTPLYSLSDLEYLEINAVHIDVTKYVEQLEALHEVMPNLRIILYYCC